MAYKNIQCPIDGSRSLLAWQDEGDPFKVYMCKKCRNFYHPPGCKCGKCPTPRLISTA